MTTDMATTHHNQVKFPLLLSQESFAQLQKEAEDNNTSISARIRFLLDISGKQAKEATELRDRVAGLFAIIESHSKMFESVIECLKELQPTKESV